MLFKLIFILGFVGAIAFGSTLTNQHLPEPRIVILGQKGAGKSTLGKIVSKNCGALSSTNLKFFIYSPTKISWTKAISFSKVVVLGDKYHTIKVLG